MHFVKAVFHSYAESVDNTSCSLVRCFVAFRCIWGEFTLNERKNAEL